MRGEGGTADAAFFSCVSDLIGLRSPASVMRLIRFSLFVYEVYFTFVFYRDTLPFKLSVSVSWKLRETVHSLFHFLPNFRWFILLSVAYKSMNSAVDWASAITKIFRDEGWL